MEARALDRNFIGLPNPCLEGVDAGDSATSTCEGTCMRNARSFIGMKDVSNCDPRDISYATMECNI